MQKKYIIPGILTGFLNGIFGGGGGMVVVPMLEQTGLETRKAHATAILIILPVCIFSSFFYFRQGGYPSALLAPSMLGIVLGGRLGSVLLSRFQNQTIRILFGFVMLAAGIRMVL